ncbi:hypothetical protein SSTG_04213 [Streptomyces sp. e14]|nr:hypothetical protein SSTG_04213 [Streptomyces sp. e14]
MGGPLDGLLLDITGWRPEETDDGVALLTELGRWPGGRALYDPAPGEPCPVGPGCADGPTGQEKRAATADARCKQRTGYVRAVHAVDVRVQTRLVAGHRGELERQRARVREAVRTARAVLESR